MAKLNIEYFAILREQAGIPAEAIETSAATPAELFAELAARYGFPASLAIKVAINDEFGELDTPLRDGDSVVFIPPVAGG